MADTSTSTEVSVNTTDESIQNPEADVKGDASAELIAAEVKDHEGEGAKNLEVETKNEDIKRVPVTPPATPIADPQPNFPKDPSTASAPKESSPKFDLPESISAPILEAATIVKAVAGISMSPVGTPECSPSTLEPGLSYTPSVVEALSAAAYPATAPVIGQTLVDGQTSANTMVAEAGKSARDVEVELLKARVKTLETELAVALAKPGKNSALVETIKQQHEELLSKARGMLFDKTKILKNQELQIAALTAQIESLKDVNSITKDLLEIRNTEVKHLEERMECMEERFKQEKERHLLVMKRAESGQAINNDLKTEYEGQLQRFKELREMYDRRVQVLTAENQRLKDIVAANGLA